MKLTTPLLLAALILLPAAARAGDVAYLDLDRAIRETDDGQKAYADLKAEQDKRQKEIDAANAEIARAKPADVQGKRDKAQQIWQRHQAEMTQRQQDSTRPIEERIKRIVAKLIAERKLAGVAPLQSMVLVAPRLDVTDEVLRRYAAGDGRDRTAERDAAKAKFEMLEREVKTKAAEPKRK